MTHRIPENSVKAAQGLEPTLQTNGGNILLGGAQKLAGPFDAIEVYKLSGVHGKQAVEQPGEIMVLEAQKIKPLSGNVTPNYGRLLAEGFDGCTEHIKAAMAKTDDPEKLKFGRDMLDTIEISMTLVDDYRAAAKE